MGDFRYIRPDTNERCQRCHEVFPFIWETTDYLFSKIEQLGYNVLCPACFDRIAAGNGVVLYWKCDEVPFEKKERID
jgi:hypothetical protein